MSRSGACARSSKRTSTSRRSSSRCAAPATSWSRRSARIERRHVVIPEFGRPTRASDDDVFRTLFGAYPDALVVADRAGKIVLANPAAAALLGYTIVELVGMEIDVLVPDAVRSRHAAYREAFGQAPRAR